MIIVKNKETGFIERLVVVDGHTHTGAEGVIEYGENSKRKNNPKNILDFHTQLVHSISRYMKKEHEEFLYEPVNNMEMNFPFLDSYFSEILGNRLSGAACDHFATFPFSDVNAYKESPYFHLPNDYILRRSRQSGYSLKLLPYIRVDPKKQHEEAIDEVEWGVLRGAVGLKLHPISQGFLSEINTPAVQDVCITALNNRLPIIFDCRYAKTGEDLYELVRDIEGRVKHKDFTVILGHTCMEYSSSELYDVLEHPNIIGDSAGMRGDDVSLFFSKLKERLPDTWSTKICYGSDNNYFAIPQSLDFVSYLFTKEFTDVTQASPQDIQNILGGNLLSRIRVFDQGRICSSKENYKGATPSKIDIQKSMLFRIPIELNHFEESSLLFKAIHQFGKDIGKLDSKTKKRTRGFDYIFPINGRPISSGQFSFISSEIPEELTEELTGDRMFVYFQTLPNTDSNEIEQSQAGILFAGTLKLTSGRFSTTPTRAEVFSALTNSLSIDITKLKESSDLQLDSLSKLFL